MTDVERAAEIEAINADVESGGDNGNEEEEILNHSAEVITENMAPPPRLNSYASLLNSHPNIKRCIRSLRKLQLSCTKIEADFYEEVHALECKYEALYDPFMQLRSKILTGEHIPTEEEYDFPDYPINEESNEQWPCDNNLPDIQGIPSFWLSVFQNVDMLSEMIQSYDEPILEKLTDVVVKLHESEPMGFIIEFHFAPNDYFTNSVLTKQYEMKCVVSDSDPFSFEGPEIYKCKGCEIDWKEGKNVTVKNIVKRQRNKNGNVRIVTIRTPVPSFFNFFNPPSFNMDDDSMEEDIKMALNADFEVGHFIRERLVPRAVLYYTGEAIDFSDDEFEEDNLCNFYDTNDDEDEEDDEDYED